MKRVEVPETGSESDHPFNKKERSAGNDEHFKQWIREHKVCFEVSPLILLNDVTKYQIGFVLYIYAQHPDSQNIHLTPADKDWMQVYVELEEIIRAAVLPDKSPCRCEIQAFDSAVRLRPESSLKPEIQLVIIVSHRLNTFDPVNKEQNECIAGMQSRLLHLGAQSRVWRKESQNY